MILTQGVILIFSNCIQI